MKVEGKLPRCGCVELQFGTGTNNRAQHRRHRAWASASKRDGRSCLKIHVRVLLVPTNTAPALEDGELREAPCWYRSVSSRSLEAARVGPFSHRANSRPGCRQRKRSHRQHGNLSCHPRLLSHSGRPTAFSFHSMPSKRIRPAVLVRIRRLIFMRQARQRERAMVERVAVFVRRGDVPAVMGESGKLRPCRETKCPLVAVT
ncbi:hypothetical protein V8C44DRAFT_267197 [Trichoderma aethiopicum]